MASENRRPALPADYFRNLTWEQIQARLVNDRLNVYNKLGVWGPLTTRQLAQIMEEDILSVRPRVTELCAMGLAEAVDVPEERRRKEGTMRQGYYRAIPLDEAKRRRRYGKSTQRELELGGV